VGPGSELDGFVALRFLVRIQSRLHHRVASARHTLAILVEKPVQFRQVLRFDSIDHVRQRDPCDFHEGLRAILRVLQPVQPALFILELLGSFIVSRLSERWMDSEPAVGEKEKKNQEER
jgi:hypothetical protein